MLYPGIIRKYRDDLPVAESSIVTLHEGNTPLFQSIRLVKELNLPIQLYYKLEGLNPTGSFKDRGMTYAVSKAHEAGFRAVICASTGNTSAAAAAYASRAGMLALVVIPKGKVARGKLAQAQIHGAKVFQVDGNFDAALNVVKEVAEHPKVTLVNSINPHRLMGQQSAAFEIVESLGDAPDYHFIPVGNAGNIVAYWRGYKAFHEKGLAKKLPQMCGFQAAGSAPIVEGHIIEHPETVATAIRIGNPANWKAAEEVAIESQGFIKAVTDEEILSAYKQVAQLDGYFCEPASAASIAGVIKMAEQGFFKKNASVVCTLTGHGLKDPDQAIEQSPAPIHISASSEELLKLIKL
ncbi:MAG: threonine synthase [Deltaproteobacteria bacterium]|nr:threonine synthase [Deltaproteobacteria bacterium]